MEHYSQEDVLKAIEVISSTISMFEKSQLKCDGTFEHVLLEKWIQSLKTSKSLLERNSDMTAYSVTDLEKALRRITPIIKTMEKSRDKYENGSIQYRRISQIIKAMQISKCFIGNELSL